MTNWSVGYELLRTYVRFAFWLTHKNVIVTGKQFIPKEKPVIFAANHQNALMDPLALVCTNPLQTIWLARADIFKTTTAQSILKFFKMLPVYRIRDGKENLANNEEIFRQVIEALEKHQSIALFPEAAHSGKRQMLPHRKAIPRIALDAEEKNNFQLGLQIVPVGIFYDHYWLFNRSLIVQYGPPIDVDSYKVEYAENQQKAMLQLRDEIHDRIIPLTLQINSTTHYHEYENLRQVAGEKYSKSKIFCNNKTLNRLYGDQELIATIEKLEENVPAQFEEIISELKGYFQFINHQKLTDELVRNAEKTSLTKLFIQFIAFIITLPVYVFGFVFNAVPFYIPRSIIRRKVKDLAFMSTFNFVVGLIVFPLFYLISALLVLIFSGSVSLALILFLLMPFAGKLSFRLFQFYSGLYNCAVLFCCRRSVLKQSAKQRNDLIEMILKPGQGLS